MAKSKEALVEQALHAAVKELGGTTRKFTSPSRAGVPDRVCLLPKGVTWWVEVKTVDGKLSVRQTRELEEYWSLGHHTAVVYGHQDIKKLIRLMEYSLNNKTQQYRIGF